VVARPDLRRAASAFTRREKRKITLDGVLRLVPSRHLSVTRAPATVVPLVGLPGAATPTARRLRGLPACSGIPPERELPVPDRPHRSPRKSISILVRYRTNVVRLDDRADDVVRAEDAQRADVDAELLGELRNLSGLCISARRPSRPGSKHRWQRGRPRRSPATSPAQYRASARTASPMCPRSEEVGDARVSGLPAANAERQGFSLSEQRLCCGSVTGACNRWKFHQLRGTHRQLSSTTPGQFMAVSSTARPRRVTEQCRVAVVAPPRRRRRTPAHRSAAETTSGESTAG
jgi:hypothetical protein